MNFGVACACSVHYATAIRDAGMRSGPTLLAQLLMNDERFKRIKRNNQHEAEIAIWIGL